MGIETMLVVGTVLSAGMQIMQGNAAMSAARAERDAAELQARQSDLEAQAVQLEGQRQSIEARKELERMEARNIVAAGLAGASSPTFATIESFNESETERQIDLLAFNTARSAGVSRINAAQSRQAGRAAISAGKSRRFTSYLGAGRDLAMGGIRLKQLS